MKIFMKVIFNLVKNKVKVNIILQMVIFIRVIGKMIVNMVSVLLIIIIKIVTLDFGLREKKMVKVFINLVKVLNIKVNIKIINDMDMD